MAQRRTTTRERYVLQMPGYLAESRLTVPPFGFVVGVDGKLAVDEAKAEVMRKCFASIAFSLVSSG